MKAVLFGLGFLVGAAAAFSSEIALLFCALLSIALALVALALFGVAGWLAFQAARDALLDSNTPDNAKSCPRPGEG